MENTYYKFRKCAICYKPVKKKREKLGFFASSVCSDAHLKNLMKRRKRDSKKKL